MRKYINYYNIPAVIALFSLAVIVLGTIIGSVHAFVFVGAGIVWLLMAIGVVLHEGYYRRKR